MDARGEELLDMRSYRSLLFVPAHKPHWAAKALAAGADAIVIDLEDSVPGAEKASARKQAAFSTPPITV